MADIGNLYYGIHFKDYSDEDIKKIKEKVKKELSTKFGIKLDFSASKSALRNSVKDALKDQKFKIDVVVDKASTQKAVRQALSKLGLNYNTTASDVRNARIEAIQQKSLIDQQLMQEKVRQQMIRNQKAEDALSNARSRGTFSIENQTSNVSKLRKEQGLLNEFMGKQSGLASQLGTQFYNMYSLVAVKRFLTSVITIGGEFEKQRIALKSILGDATKANILFSQIKTLAVESPFEFKELTSYAKQLSAFSIPYEELYDTTKRLADISAGLGVDMGRIILAYGQVRSAAFLRGQEVRQFTEAGIPLIDELANKFEKLEGKAVSAGEVFDRISKRQVSFKMVKDVLWDLTDEGGKFFNMQEELAESLSGKYANLRDSYDIMLSEMADSNNSNLKGGLELLTSLMNHWEGVANAIASAVVAVGAYKAVMAVAAAVSFVKGIYGAMQMVKVINALTGATKTLTAAQILATAINPWVAIAAAVGIAAGAFVLLRDNAKSAQELISDMNDAAAGIKDTFDKTSGIEKNLGVYDELSKKINRSAKENQRLDDVMRSLAKSVPDAIMAFDDYGNVLSIDVDKVKKYTESQRKMTEEGLEARIEDAQIRIVEINRKISEKQSELATKEEAQATWGTITPEAIRKAKIEISDLNNESVSLQNSINGARDALSKIKSLGDETPTALTGWRKIASDVLQSFKSLKQYEPKDDDEHVEWLKKIAKAYKDLGKEIAMAKSISFFDPEMLTQMEAEYNGLERIISAFGANADSLAGDKGSKKDAVADKYKERLDLLKDAYSEYKKWSALVGKDAAANKVKESGIFDSLFKGNEPVNIEDYNKELDKILASLSDKTEAQRGLKISIRKLKLDIDSDARKDAIDGLKKDMESIVANMAERWDLFKNLSKTMGNKKMAMNLAFGGEVSFGSEVEELGSMIKKEISAKNIGIGFDELIKMTPENIEKMGKDTFGVVSLLVKNYQDANKKLKAETLNTAAELVAKYRKYQDEITAIHEQANRDIEALEKNRVKFGDKYTDQAITGVRKKENEDVAAKAFDEFKKSDEWAKTFEDLDKISSATINRIISKIEEFMHGL